MMEGDDSLDQFICAKCAAPANQRCTGRESLLMKKYLYKKSKTRQEINHLSLYQVSLTTSFSHDISPISGRHITEI